MACTRADFDTHLGSLQEIANLWRFEALKKVPLLAPLRTQQKLALCAAFTAREVGAGQAVVTKGEEGHTFYIIEKGSCVVLGDNGQVRAGGGSWACVGGWRGVGREAGLAATQEEGGSGGGGEVG